MNIVDYKAKKALFRDTALHLINDGLPITDIHFYLCEVYYIDTQPEQDWVWSIIHEAMDNSELFANSKID